MRRLHACDPGQAAAGWGRLSAHRQPWAASREKTIPIYLMDGTPEGIPSNLLFGTHIDSAELCVQFRLDLAELRL